MPDKAGNQPVIDDEEVLAGIRKWVEIETPSPDGAAVNRLADIVQSDAASLGAHVERIPGRDGFGDILTVRSPWGGDGPGILVLSHMDTVHAIGTLSDANPFRRDGDRVYGPGIFDMKSGAYLAFYAFQHFVRAGLETPLPLTFLYVPEEEIGSPTSRQVIEDTACQNKYVLVTEPAHGGLCCTARKGVLHVDIKVHGRPAHAGSRHQDGRSALAELARHIVALEDLTDYERGITVNVGLTRPRDITRIAGIDTRRPPRQVKIFVNRVDKSGIGDDIARTRPAALYITVSYYVRSTGADLVPGSCPKEYCS